MNSEVDLIAGVIKGNPPPEDLPAPRLIKIFIASEHNEFALERKELLESVGPELQLAYDDMGIEVLFIDMQYGTRIDPQRDPFLSDYFYKEISAAQRHSRGCFIIALIGEKHHTGHVPSQLGPETLKILINYSSLIEESYLLCEDSYALKINRNETNTDEWLTKEALLRTELNNAAETAIKEGSNDDGIKYLLKSNVERQLEHALSLDPMGSSIIVLHTQTNSLASLISRVPSSNRFQVQDFFKQPLLSRIQTLINEDIEAKPELKSRKRPVQEVYAESLTHLAMVRNMRDLEQETERNTGLEEALSRIKSMLRGGITGAHGPIFIHGPPGSGKTTMLSSIYRNATRYLNKPTYRIVRFCSSTARSTYTLELLRILCQHLAFVTGFFDGNIPNEASFEPLYLNNWWIEILKSLETKDQIGSKEEDGEKEEVVVLLDDVDRLRTLEGEIVAALAWLPINLPPGVHFVITSATPPSKLKLTPAQKARFESAEILIRLSAVQQEDNTSKFEAISEAVGESAATRIGSILSATEFGLSESEILEIVMPTHGEGSLDLEKGLFNFASWCSFKWRFIAFLEVRAMSGRLLFSFHPSILRDSRLFYLSSAKTKTQIHLEISSIFFSSPQLASQPSSPTTPSIQTKETPFNTTNSSQDLTYTLRHVEEGWFHLLHSGNSLKLKESVVCAFDFLLAAVQMISVSYLRCVLEHTRRMYLDRDVELVYYAVRKSSDVLTREPLELGAQLISWLRSVADDGEDLVSKMVTSAMAWCDGYTAPLLVPLNSWLQQPIPLQVRSLTCCSGVKLVSPAPEKGLIIVVPSEGDPQLRNEISGQVVDTLKGHSGPITCVAISTKSDLIFTGSADTSIIVWDPKTLKILRQIQEHSSPVLCLCYIRKNDLVVSGGEDSRIIAFDISAADVKARIDHHKGPITALTTDSSQEILISCSTDKTVCLWCLDSFSLLNTFVLLPPIRFLDVSLNSVFLLLACNDHRLYLHSLATGTEIHQLKGHSGPVHSLKLAKDCLRAIVGGAEGKVFIFNMHNGRLLKVLLTGISAPVTSLYTMEKDDFLVGGGGNKITFWNFRAEDRLSRERKHARNIAAKEHTASISCLSTSKDGTMVVTGGVDSMVNLWQLNTCELLTSFEGHIASVTCVDFATSGLFIASGSEDKTVKVWGVTLGMVVETFRHQAPVVSVKAMADGRRIISSDAGGAIRIWAAATAALIQIVPGPGSCLAVSNDMRYIVCGMGNNTVRILALGLNAEEEHQVSHTQEITCLTLTPDSQSLITGSKDMSLKVWQLSGGKLSQVLVGHTDHVTCVAISLVNRSIVASGSRDSNVILWDVNTGSDVHTFRGHVGHVSCVKLSDDGSVAASGGEDKSFKLWDAKKGSCLTTLSLHVPIVCIEMSSDCSRITPLLLEHRSLPILCLHNSPAQYVTVPTYVVKESTVIQGAQLQAKRPPKRLLKKEVSLDTYTWQRKYGHLTAGRPVTEESFRRRFSVSTSLEEISKTGLQSPGGREQAALAQSKHFDQLEATWNRQKPARTRILSKQNSLRGCRIYDSDEELTE